MVLVRILDCHVIYFYPLRFSYDAVKGRNVMKSATLATAECYY